MIAKPILYSKQEIARPLLRHLPCPADKNLNLNTDLCVKPTAPYSPDIHNEMTESTQNTLLHEDCSPVLISPKINMYSILMFRTSYKLMSK